MWVLSYDVAKHLVMKLLRVLLATIIFICPDTGVGQSKFTAVNLGSFLSEIFWFYIVEPPLPLKVLASYYTRTNQKNTKFSYSNSVLSLEVPDSLHFQR